MYKYRLLEILRRKPRAEEKELLEMIPEAISVSPETFRKWLYIPEDSCREIKSSYLFQIAEILGEEAINLWNNPPTVFQLEDMKDSYEKTK